MSRFRGGDRGKGGTDRRSGGPRRASESTNSKTGSGGQGGKRSTSEVRNGRSLADVLGKAATQRPDPFESRPNSITTATSSKPVAGPARSGRAIQYQPVLSIPQFPKEPQSNPTSPIKSQIQSSGSSQPVTGRSRYQPKTHFDGVSEAPAKRETELAQHEKATRDSQVATSNRTGTRDVDPGWPRSRSLGGAQSIVQVGRAAVESSVAKTGEFQTRAQIESKAAPTGLPQHGVEKVRREGSRLWVTGVVKRHPDGFGFLLPDDSSLPDVYISRQYMAGVMTNDRVEVEVFRTKGQERNAARGRDRINGDEKMFGEVKRILSRAYSRVVGRFLPVDRRYGVIQDEGFGWGMDLRIPTEDSMGARDGDWVAAEITEYGGNQAPLVGRIVQILGDIEDPMYDVDRVVHEKGIPRDFSHSTLQEVSRFGTEVREADLVGREDLRKLSLITIDGATARDFDDAIYVERSKDGYRLIVAIADVSHYVKPGTALDEDAYNRGTSVYFPNAVVPMLPEELSNELCSLKPNVDRLCFACEMQIDRDGELVNSRFFEAVMNSACRVTYGEAQELIDGQPSDQLKRLPDVCGSIVLAAELAQILLEKRMSEGSLDLEVGESTVVVDKSGETIDVVRSERLFAHRLIEELMLITNISTAQFFEDHNLHGIFRIHEAPRLENIKALEKMMWNILGPRFRSQLLGGLSGSSATSGGSGGGKDKNRKRGRGEDHRKSRSQGDGTRGWDRDEDLQIPTVGSGLQSRLSEALKQARQLPGGEVLSSLALRSMNQAKYSADNKGHFGLGFAHYSHFTSPIRRYPDLIAHRLIKAVLVPRYRNQGMEKEELDTASTHLSACEQRAVKAERAVVSIKKARFIRRYVGEILDGVVSSVAKFGVFVTLRKFDVDGLVKLEALGPDRWVFDEQAMRLFGRRTGRVFRLGDEVSVLVVGADVTSGKIEFELADLAGDVATVEPAEILFDDEIEVQPRSQRPGKKSKSNVKTAKRAHSQSDRGGDKKKSQNKKKGRGRKR